MMSFLIGTVTAVLVVWGLIPETANNPIFRVFSVGIGVAISVTWFLL